MEWNVFSVIYSCVDTVVSTTGVNYTELYWHIYFTCIYILKYGFVDIHNSSVIPQVSQLVAELLALTGSSY